VTETRDPQTTATGATVPARLILDLRRALAEGAARTPLEPPGGGGWLAVWCLVCLAAGFGLRLGGGYHAGFSVLNALGAAYPPWLVQSVTALGGDAVPLALGLFLARRYPRVLLALILAALAAFLYSRGLKWLFETARPPAVLAAGTFNLIDPPRLYLSFPSGHSVTAGAFFGVLVYYARWVEARVLWVLIAVLVGLSRVALGVHWPVDVAFGLAGGVLSAWLGARLTAHFSGLATEPRVHLTLVAVCVGGALTLLLAGGGSPAVQPRLNGLAAGALLWALGGYLVVPLWRGRSPSDDPGGGG
jgi:membrane-associated phospholipid phosphatase